MGHALPNIAVIEELKQLSALQDKSLEIVYFGSYNGPEKQLAKANNLKYRSILCGKMRRYFSTQNIADLFKIPFGVLQSMLYLSLKRPQVVFSKGGFVSFPVCLGAWLLRIPIVLHESDLSPGLANKLCAHFAKKVCLSFDESKKFFPQKDYEITGNPVRHAVLKGERATGFKITHLPSNKPVLMVMGGSQGASQINELIWNNLTTLLAKFSIIHITGAGHKKIGLKENGYFQIEYANEDLPHLYAMTDCIITRGGANSLWEITALKIPALVIPLMHGASRGDQVENAKLFAEKFGFMNLEGNFSTKEFLTAVDQLSKTEFTSGKIPQDSAKKVANIILSFLK